MEAKDYKSFAMRTAKPLDKQSDKLLHACLGISSEVGELSVPIFNFATKSEFDENNIKEEIGDIMWYAALFCDAMGFEFESLFLEKMSFITWAKKDFNLEFLKNATERFLILSYYIGEVETIVKGHVYYDKELDAAKLKFNLMMTASAALMIGKFFSLELSEVLGANIAKLSLRYPDKFTTTDALTRADKI